MHLGLRIFRMIHLLFTIGCFVIEIVVKLWDGQGFDNWFHHCWMLTNIYIRWRNVNIIWVERLTICNDRLSLQCFYIQIFRTQFKSNIKILKFLEYILRAVSIIFYENYSEKSACMYYLSLGSILKLLTPNNDKAHIVHRIRQ